MKKIVLSIALFVTLIIPAFWAEASTLSLSPATGVYTTGSTFTVRVVVNTKGAAINAADGTLSFNPKELQVVSVSRASSIFNLWTTEPTFSNSAGTISFSGGSPTGFTGAAGTVMTATFRTLGAGSPRVTMSSGSVLAADGRGTNVLTNMGSGAYTISAISETPEPEAIVEYVPPANTPAAPKITSDTHSSPDGWSKEKTARLSWSLPSDIVTVRTLIDDFAGSIPTKVYESPIRDITIPDLDEGVSYFHIQFKNEEGWGRVAHYRLAVDSSAPQGLTIALKPDSNLANPNQVLVATTSDAGGSPIVLFKVQLNGGEVIEIKNEKETGEIPLVNLKPGRQSVVVEAFDAAGNSAVSTFTFDIESFDAPRFIDVPATVNTGVVPVFSGTTRPRSTVTVSLVGVGTEPMTYEVVSDDTGAFRFIPNGKLQTGVYRLSATAKDEFGAQSQSSDEVTFVVETSGLLKIGSFLNQGFFSVLIPLIALLIVTFMVSVYLMTRFSRFKRLLARESADVTAIMSEEFARLRDLIDDAETDIVDSRKTKKLTPHEAKILNSMRDALQEAERKVGKEAKDVAELAD
jgi:hypothetical protein